MELRRPRRRPRGAPRAATAAAVGLALVASLAACTSDDGGKGTSVFRVEPGQCFRAPTEVKAQLSSLTRTSCSSPHTQEAYAVVAYSGGAAAPASGSSAGTVGVPSAPSFGGGYPGEDALNTFAQGACAQRFRTYVGVDYLDSTLYFTFLLPSARSWEQADDRDVLCFVTTTGGTLTSSVKGSRR